MADGFKIIELMNEEIKIQKHITLLQDRCKFLKEWIVNLKNDSTLMLAKPTIPNEYYEKKDKIFQLQTELNHKEYLIQAREKDKEMFEKQRQAIVHKLNTEMGGLIKGLRTKIFPDTKQTKLADGIIKRFSKNAYPSIEHKIQDFKMATTLLK